MEKNIFENPYSKKLKQEFATLADEQRKAINDIYDLPKEERYLKPIKRKLKPNLKEGDVFAMLLPEDVYLYGKIIKKAEHLPKIEPNCFVVVISNICTKDLETIDLNINEDTYLCGPWIVSDVFWKNGKFFTVASSLNSSDLDMGFYKSRLSIGDDGKMYESGHFIDINGERISKEPNHYTLCAYITIDGIEHELRKQIIMGNLRIPNE